METSSQVLAGEAMPIPTQLLAAESFEITPLPDALDNTITTKETVGSRRGMRHRQRHHQLALRGAEKRPPWPGRDLDEAGRGFVGPVPAMRFFAFLLL